MKTLFAFKHHPTEAIGVDKALALLGLERIGTHHAGKDATHAPRILSARIESPSHFPRKIWEIPQNE